MSRHMCLAVLALTQLIMLGLSIVEATIEDLQRALSSGQINAVQLLAKHLHRVAQFDRRGPRLNAIPVIHLSVFEDAQASDDFRASSNGSIRSLLEGIPFTVKDSYMLAGLPVAAGSPAFENLTAHHDAFTVSQLRSHGALPLGKTTMPPMANGGMQRGLYGRAESPYNRAYLTAAMGSGSSNGCGTSTASSMAVFGMAEETVSSGRSPASNNGLVAYTPSRGLLSIRGNWPLSPVADVVVPHTRTVKDMLAVLDVLVTEDEDTTGDFWRGQHFISLPNLETVRPPSFLNLADAYSLKGKRIGVPRMFIGELDPAAQPVYIRETVRELWDNARITLESLGAVVKEVDFPLVTNHEVPPVAVEVDTDYPLPSYFNGSSGPDNLASYAWDDFLQMVNDTGSVTTITEVDPAQIFPQLPGTLPDRYGNRFGNRTASNTDYVDGAKDRNGTIFELPNLGPWLSDLEARRKRDLEDWMDDNSLDLVVWPAAGDVGLEDAEVNDFAAWLTWRNGVARSYGNFAIRQLGVPTVSVNMGTMRDTRMPMGLTFASKAYDDKALLSYAYAFETGHSTGRFMPPRTPALETDIIQRRYIRNTTSFRQPPILKAEASRVDEGTILISGSLETDVCCQAEVLLEIYIDGVSVGFVPVADNEFSVVAGISLEFEGPSRFHEVNIPDQSLAMIVVVATAANGRSAGKLLFA
ncbi:amidase signature domain-containing protein [Thelonectria olida]|uniref:Amidase signature domain-containing protein n=1 Tax=Thelonectria olida TaxID=1576542 RepID=A0A9P8VRK5_9HYPO|nr:amidase signature domain-containing protein [Thelonectria olida]